MLRSDRGCLHEINDHLWEGSYYPHPNGKPVKYNVYSRTREECEKRLAEMIEQVRVEIEAEKREIKEAWGKTVKVLPQAFQRQNLRRCKQRKRVVLICACVDIYHK